MASLLAFSTPGKSEELSVALYRTLDPLILQSVLNEKRWLRDKSFVDSNPTMVYNREARRCSWRLP